MNRHRLYWSVMGIEENTEKEKEKDKNILIAMIERNNNKPFEVDGFNYVVKLLRDIKEELNEK